MRADRLHSFPSSSISFPTCQRKCRGLKLTQTACALKSNNALSSANATQGIVINRKTLQRRIIQWGISRHGPAAHETAVASVERAFRYTTKDDMAIARDVNAQELQMAMKNKWQSKGPLL